MGVAVTYMCSKHVPNSNAQELPTVIEYVPIGGWGEPKRSYMGTNLKAWIVHKRLQDLAVF